MTKSIIFQRLVRTMRQANWLDSNRIFGWSVVLLVEELALLIFLALWQHGVFVAITKPTSSDFVSFYAAGKLALAGTPALAYDQTAHYLAEQVTIPGGAYQYFFYPPIFLMLCAALAKLPYLLAYFVFQAVTLGVFIATVGAILREQGWRWIAPVLAFPPVFWTLGLGQNAFLTAALFGGFTLLIDRRPMSAGALLGMLCYKPHFGLLAPVALVAGRRWSAFLAAAGVVGTLCGLSVWLFGAETWLAYIHAFAGSDSVYASGRIDFAGVVTPFGAARLLGIDAGHAYILQAIVALFMVGFVALVWYHRTSLAVRAATLLAATLLAVPLALLYDKMLALVAIAWLVREARRTGFEPWEKMVLLSTYPVSLLTWPVGNSWHIPIGPLVSMAVLLMCLGRVVRMLMAPAAVREPSRTAPSGQTVGATP